MSDELRLIDDAAATAPEVGASDGRPPAPDSSLITHYSLLSARRAEIEAKQDRVGALLAEAGADGLLLLDPANMAWLTGASLAHGISDPADWPALYLTATQRWLIAGNLDTQRLFDQH